MNVSSAKPFLLVALAVLIVTLLFYWIDARRISIRGGAPLEKTVPEPLAKGPQIYNISTENLPRFTQATFDPLDAGAGQSMTVTAKVEHETDIVRVNITFFTDNNRVTHELKFTGGSARNGTWQGTFRMLDTHDRVYNATLEAFGSDGQQSKVELTFRPARPF